LWWFTPTPATLNVRNLTVPSCLRDAVSSGEGEVDKEGRPSNVEEP
jgi:hypothetical protein